MLTTIKKIKQELFDKVEYYVKEKKCSYIDAVLEFCLINSIDIDTAATIISNNKLMVSKLKIEADSLNFLKKM